MGKYQKFPPKMGLKGIHLFGILLIILISNNSALEAPPPGPTEPRNLTGCSYMYKRQARNYTNINNGTSSTNNAPSDWYPLDVRKLTAIDTQVKSNGNKLEAVIRTLADTQASLHFIERKLREHDQANSILTQELRNKIFTLERKLDEQAHRESRVVHVKEEEQEFAIVEDVPPEKEEEIPSPEPIVAAKLVGTQKAGKAPETSEEIVTSTHKYITSTQKDITSTPVPEKKERRMSSRKIPRTTTEAPPEENLNLSPVSPDLVDRLLRHPRMRVFLDTYKTGDRVDYHLDLSLARGCENLGKIISGPVQSVDPLKTCVRIFQYEDCQGLSLAIYEGSSNSGNVLVGPKLLSQVKSVGRCVENEFENAGSYLLPFTPMYSREIVSKNESARAREFYVPDLVEFRSDTKAFESLHIRDSTNRKINYLRGHRGRLEFSESLVFLSHLRSAGDLEKLDKDAQKDKLADSSSSSSEEEELSEDVLGYVIPLALGGASDEKYNLFPQSKESKEQWEETVSWVGGFLEKNPEAWVSISVNFVYDHPKATRPSAFAYYVDQFNRKIFYGYIQN